MQKDDLADFLNTLPVNKLTSTIAKVLHLNESELRSLIHDPKILLKSALEKKYANDILSETPYFRPELTARELCALLSIGKLNQLAIGPTRNNGKIVTVFILQSKRHGLTVGVHLKSGNKAPNESCYVYTEPNLLFLRQNIDRVAISPITLQFMAIAKRNVQPVEGTQEQLLQTMTKPVL